MAASLGSFEVLLLLCVLRLEDAAYGARIQREIAERTGRNTSFGALYTALDRMSRKGLLSVRVGPPTAVRGGRRTKIYALEVAGREALAEAWLTWQRMTAGLAPRLEAMCADG